MLDRGAAVPHDAHAPCLGALRRGDVAEVKLEPQHLHSGLPCVVHDGIEELAAAEHVDEVHMLGLWDVCEAVVGASPLMTAPRSNGFTGMTRKPWLRR